MLFEESLPHDGEIKMGTTHSPGRPDSELDLFDGYNGYAEEDDYGDDAMDITELSKDFYSTDWEDPAGSDHRISSRRKIERRNELKALRSELDEWDEPFDEDDL